jgi:acetylornithine deacetylase/succinyl-diaminopimelate desuccinylase-like protein
MDVRGYIDENTVGFFDALRQWVAIPSVSADPAHRADVRRSAEWLVAYLRRSGFPVAEIWETGADGAGLPAVFAHWPAADPSAPVVLVYGHHDVQPAEPLEEWHSPPFEPTQRDGQLLGRGTSDDKGQVEAQIDLRGPEQDLHSGSFGGAVPNPLHALAELLAGLHDRDGRVTLPGFYDQVAAVSAAEREMFERLPFDEQAWLADAGHSRAAAGEAGFSTLERIWARPTAEINGMWGGHTGPGGKTIIPSQAHAKLSFRLVAYQEPADVAAALRAYVAQRTPPGIEASVTVPGPGVRPSFSPVDSPAVQAARRAMERAFGSEVLFTREGGSGPEADLADILGAPLVFLAVGLDSDRIHAPNEKVEMSLLLKGAEAAAYLWDEFAAAGDLAAAR